MLNHVKPTRFKHHSQLPSCAHRSLSGASSSAEAARPNSVRKLRRPPRQQICAREPATNGSSCLLRINIGGISHPYMVDHNITKYSLIIKYKPFISSHHPWIMCQKPWKPSDLNVAPCHPKTFRNGVGIELVHDDIDAHQLLPLDQGFPGLPGQIRNSKPGMINQNISNHINMLWASTSIFCTSPCVQCVLHIYPCACIMCTYIYIDMYIIYIYV